jgi:hypothetical protein
LGRLHADAADDTDGADGLIAARPYADDPISGSTLTTKRDLDSDRSKERLRAMQLAGEGARISGPIGAGVALTAALDADPQKVRGAAAPRAALGGESIESVERIMVPNYNRSRTVER